MVASQLRQAEDPLGRERDADELVPTGERPERSRPVEVQEVLVGQVAVEDLVVADLDNDGSLEIIAVGRATKNAVIYRQKK